MADISELRLVANCRGTGLGYNDVSAIAIEINLTINVSINETMPTNVEALLAPLCVMTNIAFFARTVCFICILHNVPVVLY
ncbi:hypothetical protein T10_3112 [Trichinella papuae]|uniref:Uncharacterized protein n=1 Tax=Trichinella papuae TaxID=268474 RepID=A0A0V1M2R0_9BILA|nr:hypothetical protein T10_3112 [Trichinella papuae]